MPIHPAPFRPTSILFRALALRQTPPALQQGAYKAPAPFLFRSSLQERLTRTQRREGTDADVDTDGRIHCAKEAHDHAHTHAMPDLSGAPPTLGSAKGVGKLQSTRGGRGRFDPAARGGRRGGAAGGRGGGRGGSHSAGAGSGSASASSPAAIPGTTASRPLSGVFAIDKPSGITCMLLLDMLKDLFALSPLFRSTDGSLPSTSSPKAWRPSGLLASYRKAGCAPPKVGQGGTLDPLASGVLVIGVGNGTRELQGFLECAKTYTATGLLGSATTSYDSQDPVMLRAPHAHVTSQSIEEVLPYFTGPLLQFPPLYSACKMDGKRLLDYARQGLELPRPIEPREIEVVQLSMTQWLPAGEHAFAPPEEEMPEEEKRMLGRVKKLAGQKEDAPDTVIDKPSDSEARPAAEGEAQAEAAAPAEATDAAPSETATEAPATEEPSESAAASDPTGSSAPAPAFRLRMTVSSGTYVRSIVHDVGIALGSAAHVQELRRVRQGGWVAPDLPGERSEPGGQGTSGESGGSAEQGAKDGEVKEGEAKDEAKEETTETQPEEPTLPALPWPLFAQAHAALLDEAKAAGQGQVGARKLLRTGAGEAGLKEWERRLLAVIQAV